MFAKTDCLLCHGRGGSLGRTVEGESCYGRGQVVDRALQQLTLPRLRDSTMRARQERWSGEKRTVREEVHASLREVIHRAAFMSHGGCMGVVCTLNSAVTTKSGSSWSLSKMYWSHSFTPHGHRQARRQGVSHREN